MLKLFRGKLKEVITISTYHMQFRISYLLANGSTRTTGLMSVDIPAKDEEEAERKLNKFVLPKIKVEIMRCEK